MSLCQAVSNPVLVQCERRLILASTFEIISGNLHQMLWLDAKRLSTEGQNFIFTPPELTRKYVKNLKPVSLRVLAHISFLRQEIHEQKNSRPSVREAKQVKYIWSFHPFHPFHPSPVLHILRRNNFSFPLEAQWGQEESGTTEKLLGILKNSSLEDKTSLGASLWLWTELGSVTDLFLQRSV